MPESQAGELEKIRAKRAGLEALRFVSGLFAVVG
jgi:hypothetical protein